ncbi:hypothetical protein BKA70DRAFT_1315423 [Coprinopsis sp. MPI-PUGE-AT-0042]|nr:hypothetical protein BKA70DRAFT_1315423 [Coprinopsis sp. MPI-PUGE-AT-0042]
MSRLSQLARAGCPGALEETSKLLTASNYTLDVLDAALMHLSKKHLPNLSSPIVSAIHVVDKALGACRRTSELKATTVSRVWEHLDAILAWMLLAVTQIGSHAAFTSVGITLLQLVSIDADIFLVFFLSPHAANLILSLWKYQPKMDDEVSDYRQTLWVPPITALVHGWISQDEGNHTFWDTILSSKQQLSTFLDALLFKLRRLVDLLHRFEMKGGIFKKTVDSLIAIFVHLERRAVPLVKKRLFCLKELATVTSAFVPPSIPRSAFLENSALVLQVARSHRVFTPIVESGLLEALVKIFPLCDWEGEAQICRGRFIMALLASNCCHARGLSEINGVVLPLLANPKLNAKGNPWYCLADSVSRKMDVFSMLTLDILTCDNISCPRSTLTSGGSPMVRVCSGCKFMTYCGTACQNADWKSRHRFECPEIRYISHRPHSPIRISQRTKAFHLMLATEAFNDPAFQAFCVSQKHSVPSIDDEGILVAALDMTYHDFPKETLSIQRWDKWLNRSYNKGICPVLESRVSSFGHEMKSGRTNESGFGISALELELEWNGEHYLSLLVRFKEMEEGLALPAQSVLRVLKREEGKII